MAYTTRIYEFVHKALDAITDVLRHEAVSDYSLFVVGSVVDMLREKKCAQPRDVDIVVVVEGDTHTLSSVGMGIKQAFRRKGLTPAKVTVGGYYHSYKPCLSTSKPLISVLLYNYKLYLGEALRIKSGYYDGIIPGLPSFIAASWAKKHIVIRGIAPHELREVKTIALDEVLYGHLGLSEFLHTLQTGKKFITIIDDYELRPCYIELNKCELRKQVEYYTRWLGVNLIRAGVDNEKLETLDALKIVVYRRPLDSYTLSLITKAINNLLHELAKTSRTRNRVRPSHLLEHLPVISRRHALIGKTFNYLHKSVG